MAEKEHYEEAMNTVFNDLLVRNIVLCQEQLSNNCCARHSFIYKIENMHRVSIEF